MFNNKITLHGEATLAPPGDVRNAPEKPTATIGNGCEVEVLRDGADDRGRPWAFVATPDGHPVGWVYRELINYN